jgi:hypothetical protein
VRRTCRPRALPRSMGKPVRRSASRESLASQDPSPGRTHHHHTQDLAAPAKLRCSTVCRRTPHDPAPRSRGAQAAGSRSVQAARQRAGPQSRRATDQARQSKRPSLAVSSRTRGLRPRSAGRQRAAPQTCRMPPVVSPWRSRWVWEAVS